MKPGITVLPVDVDDLGAGGNGDLAAAADGLEAVVFDHDDGIVDRRTSGAVDQHSALDHQHGRRRLGLRRDDRRAGAGCNKRYGRESFLHDVFPSLPSGRQ